MGAAFFLDLPAISMRMAREKAERYTMTALMTSVIDNPGKVAEYIMTCRSMGIAILPPDINEGEIGFSVSVFTEGEHKGEKAIRYGLSAIKNIGRPVIETLIRERELGGRYTDLRSFVERMPSRELNKRTVENLIKAGAMDGLGGNRRQMMMIYPQVMDAAAQAKKAAVSGQMSLFDLMGEEEKKEFSIQLPAVEEFPKEQLLIFEKEVMGIYVSGHPLETYETLWRKNITALTSDFAIDETTGAARVRDESKAVVGGIVESVTVKYTKQNKQMAFFQLEDLVGSVEIVVFPKDYERYSKLIREDARLFVRGRVSGEDDKASKLICEGITPFEDIPQDIWIQFESIEDYSSCAQKLYGAIRGSDGKDEIVIYARSTRSVKRLGPAFSVKLGPELLEQLRSMFGSQNVKVMPGAGNRMQYR